MKDTLKNENRLKEYICPTILIVKWYTKELDVLRSREDSAQGFSVGLKVG